MTRVAVINGGRYTPFIHKALSFNQYEIIEWDVIPITGYDIVFFFLEGSVESLEYDLAVKRVKELRDDFICYTTKHPCKWFIIAPDEYRFIRDKCLLKNYYRAILDSCRFGYLFKKRFRVWSSVPIHGVLCNRNCTLSRTSMALHDPLLWNKRIDEPLFNQRVQLFKKYDINNSIPTALITYMLESSVVDIIDTSDE